MSMSQEKPFSLKNFGYMDAVVVSSRDEFKAFFLRNSDGSWQSAEEVLKIFFQPSNNVSLEYTISGSMLLVVVTAKEGKGNLNLFLDSDKWFHHIFNPSTGMALRSVLSDSASKSAIEGVTPGMAGVEF